MSTVGIDPITKRELAAECWNMLHTACDDDDCKCICHDETLPEGWDDDEDTR